MMAHSILKRLAHDSEGAMAIETGVVSTALALLSLGSFQVSSMVAKQLELQSAAAEAAAIALASKPDTTQKLATIKSILQTSTGLGTNDVNVAFRYKCGTENDIERSDNCGGDEQEWKFVRVRLSTTYYPMWSAYGVGSGVNLRVVRLVQIQ